MKKKPPPPPPTFMNRKDRRALQRKRMRVIAGGKQDLLPEQHRQSPATPAGRFFIALDKFTKSYVASQPDLDEMTIAGTLLSFAAHVAAHGALKEGAGAEADEEYGRAAAHFFAAEFAALKTVIGTPTEPAPPPGPA